MGNARHQIDLDAEHALFEGRISGLVVACYEDERPLQGLAGILDWRFQGAFSRCLLSGALTGKAGECVYMPLTRPNVGSDGPTGNERTYHLILAGAGKLDAGGKRGPLPQDTLDAVQKNLSSLKLPEMGISTSDLGNAAETFLLKTVKGISIWIVH